jgi:hypothetical protein
MVADVDTVPTITQEDYLEWNGNSGTSSITVITKRRDAQARGNTYIAFGGALVALSIGLIPVAYESGRRRKRAKRRASAG